MQKSVPSDQHPHLIRDEKYSLVKYDLPRRTRDILKVFNHIINWLASLILLTEEEQKEAGIYHGLHRHD